MFNQLIQLKFSLPARTTKNYENAIIEINSS